MPDDVLDVAACAAAPLALGPSALVSPASIVAPAQCSTATIVMSVSDGEHPLASARVSAKGGEWTTDTSGQVAIEVVAGGIRVEVTAEGHVPQTVDIDAAPCGRVPVAILLSGGRTTAGPVVQGASTASWRTEACASRSDNQP